MKKITFKTTIAAVRAMRSMTGFDLRTAKQQVDAMVALANNGNSLPHDVSLITPKGNIPLADLNHVIYVFAR